jgi:amino acid adenylation domain-containing protein/non-ribosomal peptide synthase protein (TIGR01720 family)
MTQPGRIESAYPLTPMQSGMLFHTLYEAGAGAYVAQVGLELRGDLDVEAFRGAWQGVVDRHPALRTDFVWEGVEQPVQAVRRQAVLPVTVDDWRGLDAEGQGTAMDAYLRADLARGVDPARAPLMRLALFRTGDGVWQMLWTHHHLSLDGWSLPRVFAEVVALYDAHRAGRDAALPPARPYAAYAAWLRRQDAAAAERFWTRELRGLSAATSLELGRAGTGQAGHARARLRLAPGAQAALQALARRERLTVNTLVQGAWALLLSRYAGDDDVVFGATVSGRPPELDGVEEIVGLFINTLPLRVTVQNEARLLPWLRRLQERHTAAREYQYAALAQVRRWSAVPAGQPLFESILVFQGAPLHGAGHAPHGLRMQPWPAERGDSAVSHTGYPLALVASVDGDLSLHAEYDRTRFGAAAIGRMLGHLGQLLEGMARAEGGTRLGQLSLLSADERAALLAWGGGIGQAPVGTVGELIAAQAARTPDAVAAAGEGVALGYADLQRRANQLAHVLVSRGVGPEVRVALLLERGVDLAVAVLGVLKAGGAFVPLDPAQPATRLAYLLDDAGARVLLAHGSLLPLLESVPFAGEVLAIDTEPEAIGREDPPSIAVDPRSLAYLIYTSGSTGRPKGVGVEHGSLAAYAVEMARQLALGPGERQLQFASPGFDVVIEELFPAWVAGAAVVFSRADLFAPGELNRVMADEGVTVVELPTAYWHEWVAELARGGGGAPRTLRRVIVGGERVLPERLRAWAGLGLPLVHVFGLTETTVTTTTLHLAAGADGAEWGPNLPVGAPMGGQHAYVLDARGEPVPIGVAGELFIGGAGVARGYAGQPARTAERYLPDPFAGEPGARLYRTGDRVRWLEEGAEVREHGRAADPSRTEHDDTRTPALPHSRTHALTHSRTAVLEFLGRVDQQVKVRGFRIEPAEVEAALAEHPAVGEAAVVVREDAPGDRRLVAYVTPAAGYAAHPAGLAGAGPAVELWPSHGEYPVYDDLLYRAMAHDARRNAGYREALQAAVAGGTVVDVGTGGELVLARLALEAGARHVYAIEAMESAHRQARETVRALGLHDRVTLILGDAATLRLPEPVDACVSELIGCIGGSEGAVGILNHARRWLKPGGVMIPHRCVTRVAAATLPDAVHEAPAFTELGAHYAEQVFASVGHRDDVRLCIRGFPDDHLLSAPAVFEDLDFSIPADPSFRTRLEVRVERGGRLDGLLFWIQLYPGQRLAVDSLRHESAWLPLFLPVFYPGVQVSPGDVLRVDAYGGPEEGAVCPDYHLRGVLARAEGGEEPFAYDSFWRRPPARPSALHRRLVPDGEIRVMPPRRAGAGELRGHLAARLPAYMLPSAFVAVSALPRSSSGKVNRAALAARAEEPSGGTAFVAPRTEAEETLAGIWAAVLRRGRVGVHDDFFAIGGDSILSIQIVSRARTAGLHLTPRMVFDEPTVARLARVAVAGGEAVRAEQGVVTGPVPLTPIQHWFFAQEGLGHHWNLSFLFEARRPLDAAALERAAIRMAAHHDALRLRFHAGAEGWSQENAGLEGTAGAFAVVDLSGVAEADQAGAVARVAAQLQRGLHLSRGPLFRVVLLPRGPGRSARVLVAVHHLVVDGVSWRVLLQDLQSAYEQAARGGRITLPEKTTPFRGWAERLAAHAAAGGFDAELPYWTAAPRRSPAPLPADHPGAPDTVAHARRVALSLTRDETAALLEEVPRAYRTRVDNVLLTALARALAPWTGDGRLLVDLEGHGREEIFPDVDLSRTVGWFTTVHPVLLDLRGHDGPGEALRAVKEQLRAVPGRGLGWGALRWLSADPAVRAALAALPPAQVRFEYQGRFDGVLGEGDALFGLAPEPSGARSGGTEPRSHLLAVNGGVMEGRLHLTLEYGAGVHRASTATALAERYAAELRALVAHCRSAAPGFTPSDFPLARLDQASLDRVAGDGAAVEDVYPLTPLQEGMLFHTLAEPGSGVYVAQVSFEMTGALDADAFGRAWNEVVERHAALRTAFAWDGLEQPLQVVRPAAELPLHREDWRALPPQAREARFQAYLRDDRDRGFDPGRPPLMRLALFRTGADEHRFTWSFHQMVLDGWSLPLVFRDVVARYGAAPGAGALPPPRPYRDYAAWLHGQDPARAEAFWRGALAGFRAPTPLGAGGATGGEGYGRETLRMPAAGTEAVRALARDHQLTPSTVLHGAWALLLSRYSGESDVVFGTTVSGRPAGLQGVEEMVGLFINTLPARVRVDAGARLVPWLREVQARQAEIREHEHTPLVRVQRWSQVPAGRPLFDTHLVFENYPAPDALAESGGRVPRVRALGGHEQASFPLTVSAAMGSGLELRAMYQHARLDAPAAARMLGHLAALLQAMAAAPRARLADLDLVTAAERRALLAAARPAARFPAGPCIHQRFADQARRTPAAVALSYEGRTLTYAELDGRANGIARRLRALGVGPERRVGLCLERGPELVAAMLGVLRAGGAYVPLDPAYPAGWLSFVLQDADVAVLLTTAAVRGALPEFAGATLLLDEEPVEREGAAPLDVPADPAQLAYVIYTSGSTGRPKGVLVTHANVVRLFAATEGLFGFGERDVWTLFHSSAFDFSVWEIWGALLYGGRLVVVPHAVTRSPGDFHALLLREGVTVLNQTPSAFHPLARADAASPAGPAHLALRLVIFGGEALDPASLGPWFGRHGDERPRLVNMYGITETTVFVTHRAMRAADVEAVRGSPIGVAIGDLSACVLDAAGRLAPPGVPGELFVGGAGVARGYLGRPALTAERFVPDPFSAAPGARLYRTGDRVRGSGDGGLEYLARVDQQVKVRGFRIEPGEIEAVLREHPGVAEAVVVAREDAPGDRRLAAYWTPRAAPGPATPELRAFLRRRLPEHMVPAAFMELASVPLTENGKADRAALPRPRADEGAEHRPAPATATERALAAIWGEVLQVEGVGAHDNFFDLGGNSILLLQVFSRVRDRVSAAVSVTDLFQYRTVAEAAAHLDAAATPPAPAGEPGRAELRRTLTARRRALRPPATFHAGEPDDE